MKATIMTGNSVNIANCDWIIDHAKELKALFSYSSDRMIEMNKSRALADIDTMMVALNELKDYIIEMEHDNALPCCSEQQAEKAPLDTQISKAAQNTVSDAPQPKKDLSI